MKTTRTFDVPLRWAAPGLVTGLLLLSGVVAADDQKFPATGQTTCYDSAGAVIDCTGTGQDGDIQAGATLRYRDKDNGMITDRNTKLVWEKKSDDEDINDNDNTTFPHDQDNVYTWDEAFQHVATLNTICANDETVTCSVKADCEAAGVGGVRVCRETRLAPPQQQGAAEHRELRSTLPGPSRVAGVQHQLCTRRLGDGR